MFLRARTVISVFRAAFENGTLRRIGFAYALFVTAELEFGLRSSSSPTVTAARPPAC